MLKTYNQTQDCTKLNKRTIFIKADGAGSGDGSYLSPVTLARALSMAKEESGSSVLYLFEGVYHITETIRFGPEMSNVEFRALTPGQVFWDGGQKILNWEKATLPVAQNASDATQEVWAADVSELISSIGEFKFLYIDGEYKPRCRYPAEVPGLAEKSDSRLICDFSASVASCNNIEDIELVLFYDWVCRRLKIKSIDTEGIDFVPDMTKNGKATKFYIENMPLEFLAPGQWKLDLESSTVYYMPEGNENIEQMTAMVAYTPQLIEVCGQPDTNNYVENLLFDGIEFRHTGDQRLVNSNQAEWNCSAALTLSGALNCRFDNCRFSSTSGWGLKFEDGCCNNTVTRCDFVNTGAGGIVANGATEPDSPSITANNHYTDNVFSQGGRIWSGAIAIFLRHSADNLISGNEISHYHYSGISCGWVWGYGENISKNNIISNNHIHHLGCENLLADMGGIYTLGIQPGTVIHGNIIHDIEGEHISWGIYLDEGSSNIIVENNLVYNVASECFHVHYGRDNLIRNNVFAFGKTGICSVTRGTMDMKCNFKPGDIVFESMHNIMLSSGSHFYVKYILDYEIKEDLSCIESDHNIFQFSGTGEAVLGADGFHNVENTYQKLFQEAPWREAGYDRNSLSITQPFSDADVENVEWLSDSIIKLYTKLIGETL